MMQVHVSELMPNHILAQPVKGKNGIVMLESGTRLTERYIKKLRSFGIQYVSIKTETKEESEHRPSVDMKSVVPAKQTADRPDIARMKDDSAARKEVCNEVVRFAESVDMMGLLTNSNFEGRFQRQFRNVILEIVSIRELAEELVVLRQTDSSLFKHSLQVSLFSGVVGMTRDYDFSRMFDLTVGALLFDIGMTRLPVELIKMQRSLSESERQLLRQHTHEGYHILSEIKGISQDSAKCALLHHERYRGEGYPFGLKGNTIPEYAQIVSIADVYHALVSPRHHRPAYTPNEAMEYLFASGNYEFNLELVQSFIRHISAYPASSLVRLSSGQIGMVANTDKSMNHRPVIRIIQESDGTKVDQPYEIDLSQYTNLVIVNMLEEIPYAP